MLASPVSAAGFEFPVRSFLQGKPVTSDDLEYSIRLGGRLHVDSNNHEGVFNNAGGGGHDSDIFIRRGRLSISGYATSDWQYRFQAVLEKDADNDVSDAYVIYKGFGPKFWLRIGKQKEDLGLEWLTSSNTITTIERSAATRAFSHIRSEGVTVVGRHRDLSYNIGVHKNDYTENTKAVLTGRMVKRMINEERDVFQFGGGFSYREGNRGNINIRPEQREIAAIDRIDSGDISSDEGWVFNIESMTIQDNWHLSGELYYAEYRGKETAAPWGGYVMAGYFLTGEKRLYDDLHGRFAGVTPSGDKGAVELYSRLTWLDLADNGQGNKASILTTGVNWYLGPRLRLMLNYVHAEYDKPPAGLTDDGVGLTGDTSGDAIAARLQFWY
ncbi:hypothetical protein BST96_15920 [Oceanicoccus sagamiensis]|uniref:Porin n=1 Tax=Oceanicoccus sagamiensis TaxID=716816 RepID=A0A1X9ND29_9GAMM|nr:hypothetical protein BST96_15920 [Oceanicoccus sagamiensis]